MARLFKVNFIIQFILKLLIINKREDSLGKFIKISDSLCETDFFDLRLYHDNNYINSSGSWIFNNVDQGNVWPRNEKNQEDYTRDLVFCYLEWLFSNKCEISPKIEKNQLIKAVNSVFWKEPSSNSLSLYPLLWASYKKKYSNEFIFELLFNNFKNLVQKIEFGTGANHLIDNFLSLSIYSLIFGKFRSHDFFMSVAVRLLKNGTKNGYYAEKTPVYALGLAIRFGFVYKMFSRNINSNFCFDEVNEITGRLINFPKIHLNDSYLPLNVLKQNYNISEISKTKCQSSDYFIQKNYNKFNVYLVTNGVGSRGYRGHSHDSSMSFFVDTTSMDGFYIGGFGTPEYSNTKLRCLGKQVQSYPSVTGQYVRVLKSIGSFRIQKIYQPKLLVLTETISDLVSGITFIFKENSVIIRTNQNINCYKFIFWSFAEEPLISDRTAIKFVGYKSYNLVESTIYDGIYNQRRAFKHKITFQDELELRFPGD